MTETPNFDIDFDAVERAARILEEGGLVAIPTETVYGLAADADNADAVLATYKAKGRPADHPLIVHVADADAIDFWAEGVPEAARTLARLYWPGPLTIVLKKKPRCGLWVTGGQDTVALRCPSHPVAHALLERFSGPTKKGLTAPSANTFGRISPSTAGHVAQDLGVKPEGKLDMILEGGPCEFGIESTMVNLSSGRPEVLRHGVITRAMLEETLGVPVPDAGKDAPRASGRLKSHYAPKTKLELAQPDAYVETVLRWTAENAGPVALMAPAATLARIREALAPERIALAIEASPDVLHYGAELYDHLHALDDARATRIFVEAPPATPEWAAVNDRLWRAAA